MSLSVTVRTSSQQSGHTGRAVPHEQVSMVLNVYTVHTAFSMVLNVYIQYGVKRVYVYTYI